MNGSIWHSVSTLFVCLAMLCLLSVVDAAQSSRMRDRETRKLYQQQQHQYQQQQQQPSTSTSSRFGATPPGSVYASKYRSHSPIGRFASNFVLRKRQPETVPTNANLPDDMDFVVDEEDNGVGGGGGVVDKNKRFEEYGHMRFGKRTAALALAGDDGDDYGHMRFGKRVESALK